MKRALLLMLAMTSSAHALMLSGSIEDDLPGNARVGAWLVSNAGLPLSEVASAAVQNGAFRLALPEDAPSGRARWSLTGDSVTWPGVAGNVTATSGVETGELRLFVYADANSSGRREENERLLEASVTAGKASVAFVYVNRESAVSGPRGLNVTLPAGWSALVVELGRTLKTSVLSDAATIRLNVVR
ncbi:hypothetical protein [Deinococcus yavapaiensis]|uniref:Uncharacterized protein n=1 Tax=Deinococcus yavapaiensis KR-236 TaxID=694435 RepID=A0A318S7N8_9DEIO|nr:hypothetical protein [Deinococcus yavapaiensis]PYE54926.1 hypothetical protein DES52_104199 [Deinococcus yavapaiensis KR-236]